MSDQPVFLLTNDDGIHAEGLVALRRALMKVAHTVVVAPEVEQSASSHSITLNHPLRHRKLETDLFTLDGTPADCVYIALFSDGFLPRKPDLVLSGINNGVNLGTDIYYSGTVGAAREANIHGIPSIALSSDGMENLDRIARISQKLSLNFYNELDSLTEALLLNVNFPKGPMKGTFETFLAQRCYHDHVVKGKDPRGRDYFWIGGKAVDGNTQSGADTEAIKHGYISISPVSLIPSTPSSHHIVARIAKGCMD